MILEADGVTIFTTYLMWLEQVRDSVQEKVRQS